MLLLYNVASWIRMTQLVNQLVGDLSAMVEDTNQSS